MGHKLVSRQKQVPNGFTYFQPETKWRPTRFPSFQVLVQEVASHRSANPELARKYPTKPEEVAEELDRYNAEICARNGWVNYIIADEGWVPPPKIQALLQAEESARSAAAAGRSSVYRTMAKMSAGVSTLADWLGGDGKPVAPELSNARAAVCAGCPQNQAGDLTSFFTKPVANLLQKQVAERNALKLSTPDDARLGVCAACGCPLKLKVHVPLKYILAHMKQPERVKLDPRCWITAEEKGA